MRTKQYFHDFIESLNKQGFSPWEPFFLLCMEVINQIQPLLSIPWNVSLTYNQNERTSKNDQRKTTNMALKHRLLTHLLEVWPYHLLTILNWRLSSCWTLHQIARHWCFSQRPHMIWKNNVNVQTQQQKVSMYAKWFHWILSEFIGLVNGD
jgi:hypothetical protein